MKNLVILIYTDAPLHQCILILRPLYTTRMVCRGLGVNAQQALCSSFTPKWQRGLEEGHTSWEIRSSNHALSLTWCVYLGHGRAFFCALVSSPVPEA